MSIERQPSRRARLFKSWIRPCLATIIIGLNVIGLRAVAQDRPALLFREDWKESPAVTPVTQEHVANPDLIMTRHGPGEAQIRKSHHDKPADDPFYIWSGEAERNWAL